MTKIPSKKPGGKGDNPPIFSHEFIRKNHGDILSCACMVVFVMIMFQATNHIGSQFIFIHYNETEQEDNATTVTPSGRVQDKAIQTFYRHGPKDAINVLFYSVLWIIIHAVVHEYIWERTARKLHLSKTKHHKYYDSGFLIVFYLLSLVWGCNIIFNEGYLIDVTQLWNDFPHDMMKFGIKFFMLNQMAFWLHCYPELYFMKAKKEDIPSKLLHYTSLLLLIAGAYSGRLQRLMLVLLMLHYLVELSFHLSRLLHYHQKKEIASMGFTCWHVLSVVCRLGTVVLSVITLQFGLKKVEHDNIDEDVEVPFYETSLYRTCCLAVLLLFQAILGWNFVSYQLSRRGEDAGAEQVKIKQPVATRKNKGGKNSDAKKKN
ncbi:translocating chain-associated membrane protein 1-like [Dysidea avara]|uniref:translocating chain-associated membrane protein 1-like n=1 Tax=Dysidea avara TaxID=196820 RepID=UPI0033275729